MDNDSLTSYFRAILQKEIWLLFLWKSYKMGFKILLLSAYLLSREICLNLRIQKFQDYKFRYVSLGFWNFL